MALSPEQPLPQPSLSGGQEGAKNSSVGYPGDKVMTLNYSQANSQTNKNPDETSTKEGSDKGNSLIETLSPYEISNEVE